MKPLLMLVATPLGNPGDLSPRAREALEEADLVLVEDTRRAGSQFKRWGLRVQRMLSFFEHNEQARTDQVLGELKDGARVALMSDAGAPCVADPGYQLVRACQQESIPVTPIPGPSAVICALMASGLPAHPFTFLGFLPRKPSERNRTLAPFAEIKTTLVFFERKNRVLDALHAAHELLGNRDFCLARELTKTHEQFILGQLGDLSDVDPELKGEVTVVIGPPEAGLRTEAAQAKALMRQYLDRGIKAKEAARQVREKTTGWSAKELYALAVEQGNGDIPDGE